jgi:hypothetical protein
LFFDFTRNFVDQFHIDMQWCVKGQVILFGKLLTVFWLLKCIFLEAEFEFLFCVILYRIKFRENLAQTSLDKVFPRLFLVSNEIRDFQRSVVAREEDTLYWS